MAAWNLQYLSLQVFTHAKTDSMMFGRADLTKIIVPTETSKASEFPYATATNNKFAQYTLRTRLPQIVDRLLLDDRTGQASWARLSRIKDSLVEQGRVPPLEQNPFFSQTVWDNITRNVRSWRSSSFLSFEYYFYYKILEAAGTYFHLRTGDVEGEMWHFIDGAEKADPFYRDKDYGELKTPSKYWSRIHEACDKISKKKGAKAQIKSALLSSLIMNQQDASQLRQYDTSFVADGSSDLGPDFVLDHSERLIDCIFDNSVSRIDIICDNFYQEFVADLILANTIIRETGKRVTMWVKNVPSFVSDVTLSDWIRLRRDMLGAANGVGAHFRQILDGSLFSVRSAKHLDTHLSFSAALDTDEGLSVSPPLLDLFTNSDLIIVKGDLNYRKLVDDRLWEPSVLVRTTVKPQVFCVRAVKSACLVGVDPRHWPITLDELNALLPPAIRTNVKYKMIIQGFQN